MNLETMTQLDRLHELTRQALALVQTIPEADQSISIRAIGANLQNALEWIGKTQTKLNEEWRDIPGFDYRYQVSSHGRVRRANASGGYEILTGNVRSNGYRAVNLTRNGKPEKLFVHRLVLAVFKGAGESRARINHIDGDRLNNHLSNLEYIRPAVKW